MRLQRHEMKAVQAMMAETVFDDALELLYGGIDTHRDSVADTLLLYLALYEKRTHEELQDERSARTVILLHHLQVGMMLERVLSVTREGWAERSLRVAEVMRKRGVAQ